jgi:hypothetical protein
MANRYAVVARTYLRWRLVDAALYLFFFLACFAVAGSGPDIFSLMFLVITYLGIGLFAWCIGYHLNEQFANPRSRLLPDFGPPHLAIAAAVSLPILALTTGVLWWVGDESLLGTAAVALTIFTALVCVGCLKPALSFVVLGLLGAVPATPQGRLWYDALVEGRANPGAALVLCSCSTLLVAFGAWLLCYNEDRPQFMDPWDPSGERRLWSAWKGRKQWDLPRLMARNMAANPGGGWWRRVQLWRVGMSPLNMALVPLGMLGACFALSGVLKFFGVFTGIAQNAIQILLPSTFYMTMMSNSMVAGLWLQRWPRLGYESLRPTTRRDFCRQMGLAFACELFEGWLWCLLVLGFGVAIWSPALLQTWDVVVFLSLFACMLLSQLAAIVWVESYFPHVLGAGAMSRQVLVGGAMILISIPSFVLWGTYQASLSLLAAEYYFMAAMGIVIVCVGLLYLAYRRWLWLDLP